MMAERRFINWAFTLAILATFIILPNKDALAVPSFARQTGMECTACHTVFPELTPLGRSFKIGGYLMSRSNTAYEFPPPLAGMAQISYSQTHRSQPPGSIDDNWATRITSGQNDVLNIPQQLSIFYGGRVLYNVGAFLQGTFDGPSNSFFLDNTDIRYADIATVWGKKLIYGLTLNNNPTAQDAWNTTPAWGFPYAASGVAPTPAAAAIIDGTLGQQVGGIGLYGYWDNLVYAEATVYRTAKNGITKWLGGGTPTDMRVQGAAPYWRLALQHVWEKKHSLSVGTYGMVTDIFPEGNGQGPTDKFTDIAFDAQYQYIVKKHVLSAQTTFIHENQNWDASYALGGAANKSDHLNTFRINLNYYYRSFLGQIGGSAAYFSTTGSKDDIIYSPDPLDGSRTGKPDSDGFMLEADFLPWKTGKFSLQYTIYNKFNGGHTNYDGSGRNAADNNTIYLLVWLMF
jgi:hypothetical protein